MTDSDPAAAPAGAKPPAPSDAELPHAHAHANANANPGAAPAKAKPPTPNDAELHVHSDGDPGADPTDAESPTATATELLRPHSNGDPGADPTDAEPPTATATDAELLRAHSDGDPAAFAELVRRHRHRLWAVALRTTGDREDAADALQDALLSAHRAAGRFRGDSAVTTWLHRIVVNACLDRMRRRLAHPTVPLPDGNRSDDGLLHGQEPAAPAADHETALVVREALAALPTEQRAAIILVDVQGYPVAEAAEILGVAEGTIKSRCARGRAKMALTLGYLRPDRPRPQATPTGSPSAAGTPSPTGSLSSTGSTSPTGTPSPAGSSSPTGRPGPTSTLGPIGPSSPTASTSPPATPGPTDSTETTGPTATPSATESFSTAPARSDRPSGSGDEHHGNPSGAGRVPLGSAAPSEGRDRP